MHRPTARVLTVLELLQPRKMTGPELARRLEVDERTVRRYITTLQELGVPVNFAYSQATDRLTFTPASKLSYGRHTVEVKATDGAGQSKNKIWGFKIVR